MSVADALADGIERYGVSVLGIVGRLTAFRSNVCGARSVSGSFQEMQMVAWRKWIDAHRRCGALSCAREVLVFEGSNPSATMRPDSSRMM